MASTIAFSVCYVTVGTSAVAEVLAKHLVAKRVAACVNIIPQITSVYEWEGKVETSPELLLMIKTQTALVPKLIEEVRANHPYDVPEVISVPMGQGHTDYLNWVRQGTTPLPEKEKEAAVPAAAAYPTPATVAVPAPAVTGGCGGGRVVDRLVPNGEKYSIHQDYTTLLNQINITRTNEKYYILQLLKDAGGSFFVWTRWGRGEEPGQNALQSFGEKESSAILHFSKKFCDKTANEWNNHANFVPRDGKYKIVEMDEKDEGAGSKAPMGEQ